jgi:hypothetical protein
MLRHASVQPAKRGAAGPGSGAASAAAGGAGGGAASDSDDVIEDGIYDDPYDDSLPVCWFFLCVFKHLFSAGTGIRGRGNVQRGCSDLCSDLWRGSPAAATADGGVPPAADCQLGDLTCSSAAARRRVRNAAAP